MLVYSTDIRSSPHKCPTVLLVLVLLCVSIVLRTSDMATATEHLMLKTSKLMMCRRQTERKSSVLIQPWTRKHISGPITTAVCAAVTLSYISEDMHVMLSWRLRCRPWPRFPVGGDMIQNHECMVFWRHKWVTADGMQLFASSEPEQRHCSYAFLMGTSGKRQEVIWWERGDGI